MSSTGDFKNIRAQSGVGFAGRFKLALVGANGERRVVAEFNNRIVDSGLQAMLYLPIGGIKQPMLVNCVVGSSSVEVNDSQTALGSTLAREPLKPVSPRTGAGGEPYRTSQPFRCQFPVGVATGVVTEVGIEYVKYVYEEAKYVNLLFCRALILDSDGVPSSITVSEDEFLEVTYVLDAYIDVEDKVFTLSLPNGEHTCVVRPCRLNSQLVSLHQGASLEKLASVYHPPNGALGSVIGEPEGRPVVLNSDHSVRYEPSVSVVSRDITFEIGRDAANHPDGLSAIKTDWLGYCAYQISFDPPIPKTVNSIFQLTLTLSVGRM